MKIKLEMVRRLIPWRLPSGRREAEEHCLRGHHRALDIGGAHKVLRRDEVGGEQAQLVDVAAAEALAEVEHLRDAGGREGHGQAVAVAEGGAGGDGVQQRVVHGAFEVAALM